MTTLISFLGKQQKGYRYANYQFSNGEILRDQFFGMSLAEQVQPHRLILIGTQASMWDVFFEHDSKTDDRSLLQLMEAVESGWVTDDLLSEHADRLRGKLNCEVDCLLIPYAKDCQEQASILTDMAALLTTGEEVVLDVTHGFRHLPMLAMIAARYLKFVKKVHVRDIYYGALEMTQNEITPVLHLGGMLTMLDWVDALSIHDHDGSYRQFADLIDAESISEPIRSAQYFEQTGQLGKVRKPLKKVLTLLDKKQMDDPMLALFRPQLKSRIDWILGENHSLRQARLAQKFLQTSQYARAVEMGFEAFINKLVQDRGKDPENYIDRQETKEIFESMTSGERKQNPYWKSYEQLREIRNSLSHGTRAAHKAAQNALDTEANLRTQINGLFNTLLP